MRQKFTYQELERKIKQLEKLQEKDKAEINFLKKREKELKFMLNEFQNGKTAFLKSKTVILKIKNITNWPIVSSSQNVIDLLEYSIYDIQRLEINLRDVIHPEYKDYFEQVLKSFENDEETKETKQFEIKIIKKTDETSWVNCQIIAIKERDNSISHFQIIFVDISAQKRLEKELRDKEEQYRLLFENSPLGVFIGDKKGNILNANDSLIEILGSPSKEHTKKINVITFDPLIKSGYTAMYKECINSGMMIKGELRYTSKWGQNKCYKGHLVPIRDENNEIEKVYTIIEDISKQKEVERILIQSEKALKIANSTKDKFFSIIAHDLRSPFNTILGFVQVLLSRFDKIEKTTHLQYLKIIEKTTVNTYNLLDDLLLWANTQREKIKFKTILINLNVHIENAIEILINTASEKSIKINKNISKDIFLYADKEMLSVIIRNLVSNAIKFTPKGGEINIYSKVNSEKFVEITVEDNGKGMNAESLNNLFKIDKTISSKGTEGETGTGLGLILCKEFVEKHDGTIRVESKVEKGSKFSFTLPIN